MLDEVDKELDKRGFSFYFGKGGANIRIHEKSYKIWITDL
jgi:hypothetical protein